MICRLKICIPVLNNFWPFCLLPVREKPTQDRPRDAEERPSVHVCYIRSLGWSCSLSASSAIASYPEDVSTGDVPADRQRLWTLLRQSLIAGPAHQSIKQKEEHRRKSRLLRPRRVSRPRAITRHQALRKEVETKGDVRASVPLASRSAPRTPLSSDWCKRGWTWDSSTLQLQVATETLGSPIILLQQLDQAFAIRVTWRAVPNAWRHALIEAMLPRRDPAQRTGENTVYDLFQGVPGQPHGAYSTILFVPTRANPEQLPNDRHGLSCGSWPTPIGAQFKARGANYWWSVQYEFCWRAFASWICIEHEWPAAPSLIEQDWGSLPYKSFRAACGPWHARYDCRLKWLALEPKLIKHAPATLKLDL